MGLRTRLCATVVLDVNHRACRTPLQSLQPASMQPPSYWGWSTCSGEISFGGARYHEWHHMAAINADVLANLGSLHSAW